MTAACIVGDMKTHCWACDDGEGLPRKEATYKSIGLESGRSVRYLISTIGVTISDIWPSLAEVLLVLIIYLFIVLLLTLFNRLALPHANWR